MLGNVCCGAVVTGSVSLRNVLTLPFSELTKLPRGADVQDARTLL